jgi:hypothetical protein
MTERCSSVFSKIEPNSVPPVKRSSRATECDGPNIPSKLIAREPGRLLRRAKFTRTESYGRLLATNGPAPHARLRSGTLVCVEKVRSQFLSLRHVGRGSVFSRRNCRQLSPVTAAISNLNSGPRTSRNALLFSEKPGERYDRHGSACLATAVYVAPRDRPS